VKRYLDVRLAEGAARESIRKELTTLRAALREAVALGWMTKAQSIDAIPDFTARYKPRTRWLKRDEYAKLLDALEMVELPAGKSKSAQKLVKPSPRLGLRVVNRRLWVAIAVGLGARRSEVESIDWAEIDLDAGTSPTTARRPRAATARHRSRPSCSWSCARSPRRVVSGVWSARGRTSAVTSRRRARSPASRRPRRTTCAGPTRADSSTWARR
jgi:integrase